MFIVKNHVLSVGYWISFWQLEVSFSFSLSLSELDTGLNAGNLKAL
jgi:hypothetical protein